MSPDTGSYLQVNTPSSTVTSSVAPYYSNQASAPMKRLSGYQRPMPSSFSIPTWQIAPRRLADGRLVKEVMVLLSKGQDGRYLMTDPTFNMHGEGDTIPEAEQVFLAGLVAARYNLGLRADRLSPYMRRKFDFVKSLIDLD